MGLISSWRERKLQLIILRRNIGKLKIIVRKLDWRKIKAKNKSIFKILQWRNKKNLIKIQRRKMGNYNKKIKKIFKLIFRKKMEWITRRLIRWRIVCLKIKFFRIRRRIWNNIFSCKKIKKTKKPIFKILLINLFVNGWKR